MSKSRRSSHERKSMDKIGEASKDVNQPSPSVTKTLPSLVQQKPTNHDPPIAKKKDLSTSPLPLINQNPSTSKTPSPTVNRQKLPKLIGLGGNLPEANKASQKKNEGNSINLSNPVGRRELPQIQPLQLERPRLPPSEGINYLSRVVTPQNERLRRPEDNEKYPGMIAGKQVARNYVKRMLEKLNGRLVAKKLIEELEKRDAVVVEEEKKEEDIDPFKCRWSLDLREIPAYGGEEGPPDVPGIDLSGVGKKKKKRIRYPSMPSRPPLKPSPPAIKRGHPIEYWQMSKIASTSKGATEADHSEHQKSPSHLQRCVACFIVAEREKKELERKKKNVIESKSTNSTQKPSNFNAGLSDANERKSRKDTAGTEKKDFSVSVSPSRKVKEASPGPSLTTTRRSHGDSTSTKSLSKSPQKAPSKKSDHKESSTKMLDAKPPRPARSSSRNPGKSAHKSDVGNQMSNLHLLTREGENNLVETAGQTDPTEESEQPRTSKEGGDGTGTKRGSTTQNLDKRPKHELN